jgi:hypothetical protein
MNKVIVCLEDEKLYLDPEVQKAVLKISGGILIRGNDESLNFYLANKEKLPKSMVETGNAFWKTWKNYLPELRRYADEMFTTNYKTWKNNLDELVSLYPNIIFGDLEEQAFEKITKKYLSAEITYTAYQTLWFKMFGIRIYKPFSNQIKEWEKLKSKYGELWTSQYRFAKIRESKFNHCWISLTKNKNDYKELIQWCREKEKQILLFVDSGLSKEKFLELMEKFKKCL